MNTAPLIAVYALFALTIVTLSNMPDAEPLEKREPFSLGREPGAGMDILLPSGIRVVAVYNDSLDLEVTAAGKQLAAFKWPDSGAAYIHHAGGFQIPISAVQEAERLAGIP
jgi:hypothetical protein